MTLQVFSLIMASYLCQFPRAMIHLRDSAVRVLVAAAIAGTVAGCTPSKASQCKKLSNAVNKMRPIAEKFQRETKNFEAAAKAAGTKNDLNAFKGAAANLATDFNGLTGEVDGLIKELDRVELKDETLTSLKQRYVQNVSATIVAYKTDSDALATISKAENSPKGRGEIEQAIKAIIQTAGKMNVLTKEDTEVVADFNRYCSANQ
ncbi:MAG: hypothetical protein HC866_11475 [Leptolyngbyaceae cyanobacterium RU_5_1]|nr:hypothetical protein [Leptolyngbyaceae cyanobacterium RU_5_1]